REVSRVASHRCAHRHRCWDLFVPLSHQAGDRIAQAARPQARSISSESLAARTKVAVTEGRQRSPSHYGRSAVMTPLPAAFYLRFVGATLVVADEPAVDEPVADGPAVDCSRARTGELSVPALSDFARIRRSGADVVNSESLEVWSPPTGRNWSTFGHDPRERASGRDLASARALLMGGGMTNSIRSTSTIRFITLTVAFTSGIVLACRAEPDPADSNHCF